MTKVIKNALLSVYNKSKIIDFAKKLKKRNIAIYSTGGTYKTLSESNIKVINISNYINFPEILDGRIKTIHPKIYAGILQRGKIDEHIIKKNKIVIMDMIVVNFYNITDNNNTFKKILTNIDIGGPGMVRSGAKNYKNVTVIVDFKDYDKIISEMKNANNKVSLNTRFNLAKKAFQYSLEYEKNIFHAFKKNKNKKKKKKKKIFPNRIELKLVKYKSLLYGENPHQKSYIYKEKNNKILSNEMFKQITGDELSYNNINDIETAIKCIYQFKTPTCLIIKHSNPCAAATDIDINNAYIKAYYSDSISSFGGIIVFNRKIDENTLDVIFKKQFVEIIIAPSSTKKALAKLKIRKKVILIFYKNINLLNTLEIKNFSNGFLIQEYNSIIINKFKIVSKKKPTKKEIEDSIFAWKINKFTKSNSVVCVLNKVTLGIGSGQTSRLDATKISIKKSLSNKTNIYGSVLSSDAFLPFRDNIDIAAKNGITCIIQSGGSIRDKDTIDAVNEHNMSMLFTNLRHFKH
ncbi:bifunctional phosphoribosylaminoimidazolecarboxamide formyltransferase/IMP cyclohydrolase [Buchnera aphidicola (Taiwanaphis decaspermi)]|uniref:bifunctional phosphoribosylaminoimidazolecarboxamide formyltransferase/IMP cyclohydrolase n=1 Tax=Buchnera aphidicola TaxID=9 RepID=UPI0031B8A42E